jgi:hypothetical protein
MKKYLYKGQISRFSLEGKDYCLEPGKEYDLPSESQYIKVLVASGVLVDSEAKKETTLKKS